MDLDKVVIAYRSLQAEETNLCMKIHQLEIETINFKRALGINKTRFNFIKTIHEKIIDAISNGKQKVLIETTIEVANIDEMKHIHTRIRQLLTDCGINEAKVEGKNEFMLRTKNDIEKSAENTFISFTV